jgi:dolichol-phosphate mannosyltransferase
MKNKLISIVVPVLNEQETLSEFYRRTKDVFLKLSVAHEIIFVDDGSSDDSLRTIQKMHNSDSNVKCVSFSRNFGHASAITAGLNYAKGDAVVVMDADLQDPPEVLPSFFEKWQEGKKVVYGVRTKRKEWLLKRFAYWAFYRLFKRLASLKDVALDAGDFALIDRAVVGQLKQMPERNRFLRGMRSWVGYEQCGVTYERASRYAGSTKYPFKKLMKLAFDGIFSFSYIPLRLATYLGFVVAFIALLGIIIVFYLRIAYGVIGIPGFSSTIIAILFIGAIQLVSIGILGEYIGRIYDEVKQRPTYVIGKKIGLD